MCAEDVENLEGQEGGEKGQVMVVEWMVANCRAKFGDQYSMFELRHWAHYVAHKKRWKPKSEGIWNIYRDVVVVERIASSRSLSVALDTSPPTTLSPTFQSLKWPTTRTHHPHTLPTLPPPRNTPSWTITPGARLRWPPMRFRQPSSSLARL